MKKLTFSLPLILIVSFFLFSIPVNAQTKSFDIYQSQFNLLSTIDDIIPLAENICTNYGDCDDYAILNSYDNYIVFFNSNSNRAYYNVTDNYIYFNYFPSNRRYDYSNGSLILANQPDNKFRPYQTSSMFGIVLYVKQGINIINAIGGDIFQYTYYDDNSYTYSFTYNGSEKLPTIYDLKNIWFPPIPDDDYPLLTSFFTLVLGKIGYLADYISSSYLFLSIFAVFIFYYVILLFRRLT